MAKYNELFGQLVQYISSDPSNLEEGNVWYNSTSNTLKARAYQNGSWSSGDNVNTARSFMNKKQMISQSIMWAAAILVVAIVEDKQFAILMLVILGTVSLMFLKKGNE